MGCAARTTETTEFCGSCSYAYSAQLRILFRMSGTELREVSLEFPPEGRETEGGNSAMRGPWEARSAWNVSSHLKT